MTEHAHAGDVRASKAHGVRLIKPLDGLPFLESMKRPTPGRGEVLVRVLAVGLCRTDLLVAHGDVAACRDICLGHEFSGIVEEAGAGVVIAPGTRVSVDPTFRLPCGRDGYMGVDAPGAIASWVVVPSDRVFDATGLDPFQAAYLEPIAAAMGALPDLAPGTLGAIVGDNRIASLTSRIVLNPIGRHGLAHMPCSEDRLAGVEDDTFDWVLETRLTPRTLREAVRTLKPGGTLVLKSRHLDEVAIPAREIVMKRITIAGRTRGEFAEAMRWLVANRDFVSELVGDRFPLDRWQDAFAAAGSGEGAKTFLVMPDVR